MSIKDHSYTLIDFLRSPRPQGERRTEHTFVRARRSQNQFTPLGAGVNKLIFKRYWILYISLPIVILIFADKYNVNILLSLLYEETFASAICRIISILF
jgi:hypothetical protein